MKNKKKSQEADKYGQITFGKAIKLLVGIIGQNAILDLVPKKSRESYKTKTLPDMYKGKLPYNGFARLQCYCDKFFKKIESEIDNKNESERGYGVSPLVMTSLLDLKPFVLDFSLYAESNKILDKSKNEIALYSLQTKAFCHILYDDSSKKDPLSNNVFKASENEVLVFLTDSYDEIFKNKDVFDKAFYKEITTKQGKAYRKIINYWRDKKKDHNPNWRTLVPILDYLRNQGHISFVHRLIGLYLRKNAQKALADVLDISEDELKEIIVRIVTMIREKKRPEKFPVGLWYDDMWYRDQRIKIYKCLELQNNYENSIDAKKVNSIIAYSKRNYYRSPEGKFLYFWLQTRAKVFEKHSDLKDYEEVKEEITKGYREALDELLNGAKSHFLIPFLLEIMLINDFSYPRRVKAKNDYYEYGRILGANEWNVWEENKYKEFRNPDVRKSLVDIYKYFLEIQRPFWKIISRALNR